MKKTILYIPFANGQNSVLAADGPLANQLLAFLADVLGLQCQCAEIPQDNVFLRIADAPIQPEDGWMPWNVKSPFAGKFYWRSNPFQVILAVRPHPSWETLGRRVAVLRRLFSLAVINQTLQDSRVSLMHGVLLQPPKRHGAALLFGLSGIGKSTMSNRFAQQGGTSPADDLSVLTYLSDGRLVAQPAPTWSRIAMGGDSHVDFRQSIPVEILLNQMRGDDDKITPASPVNWRLGLVGGMMEFVSFPPSWLELEIFRRVVAAGGPFVQKCMERFPFYQVEGALDGHIMNHLNDFLDHFKHHAGAEHETEK